MAVGDVIIQTEAASTQLDFQPAAGVEVMVSCLAYTASGGAAGIFDGTNMGSFGVSSTTQTWNMSNAKIMINNTAYLRMLANSYPIGFTGIQIK